MEMDPNAYDAEIERLDLELAEQGVSVYQREVRILLKMCPGTVLFGQGAPPEPKGRISTWLHARYGSRVFIPRLGRVPLIFRHQLFFVRIPLTYGRVQVSLRSMMEGFTDHMLESLKGEEAADLLGKCQQATDRFNHVFALGSALRKDNARGQALRVQHFAVRGIDDLHSISDCLDQRADTAGAGWHGQQAAEKLLKAVLCVRAGRSVREARDLGHSIQNLWPAVRGFVGEPALEPEFDLLQTITPAVRYDDPPPSLSEAVRVADAAFLVASSCSRALLETPNPPT